jgi:hypothetical protein
MTAQASFIHLLLIGTLIIPGLLLFIFASETASGQGTFSINISGRVVNGTAEAEPPSGLSVSLLSFDTIAGSVLTTTSTTDDLGRFRFDNLIPRAGLKFTVTMEYAGVAYSSNIMSDEFSKLVELVIYEPTTNVDVIEVEQQVLVVVDVDKKNREIDAVELIRIVNGSDRTLLPDLSSVDEMSFLRFPLPPNFSRLNVQSDLTAGNIIALDTGFAVTAPVVPGEHHIDSSYSFTYEGNSISYRQTFLQGVQRYQVMVPDALSRIDVLPLLPVAPVVLSGSGIEYRVWELTEFSNGQGFTLEIKHLPEPNVLDRLAKSVNDDALWRYGIPALVGTVLIILLLYSTFVRLGKVSDIAESTISDQLTIGMNRKELVLGVAALDDKFQKGQIDAEKYKLQRTRMVAYIIGISNKGKVNWSDDL